MSGTETSSRLRKRPSGRPACDRVDVREPGQVADDRADRAAAAAAGREHVARDRVSAHLPRALARQLQHLPVQEEESREAELLDQLQLLVEPPARPALVAVRASVALGECAVADAPELRDRRLARVREVRVAVAEVLGQVELQARGQLARALDGVAVVREALPRLLGREQDALAVAPPLRLAAFERGAVTDRDEHVLERGAPRMVRVDVSGGDRLHAQRLGEVAQRGQTARVASLVRALQLDEEALGPERPRQRRRAVRAPNRETVPRAPGEADEALVQLHEQRRLERGRRELGPLTRVRVCRGQQPAEVRVALRGLDEQRHVRTVGQRHLRAGDRPHAERLRRVRELERAVHTVVVGQGKRLVSELGRASRKLLGLRGPVEERIG